MCLWIPEETVGALTNPQDGISIEGMTQQEAAERAVRTIYQAVIGQDLDRLKSICPPCQNWGDEFLRAIIFRPDKDDRIVEVLRIGPISKTGHSVLGPIVAVPTVVKLKNGKKGRQLQQERKPPYWCLYIKMALKHLKLRLNQNFS